jgi:transcriptional regulator with PAS, ATPase and Fis domain
VAFEKGQRGVVPACTYGREDVSMFDHLDLFTDIKHLIEFQRKIIEYSADGLMVVDKDGRIVYINDSFKELHNVNEQEVINSHVTDIIDNTRMHIVAQTGIAEHDHFQDISGTPYVVSRIPIVENDECVGAIGLIRFRYMEEVQALTDKITKLREQLKTMHAVRSASADTEHTFDDIMGVAPAVKQAKEAAMQAARTEATVLLHRVFMCTAIAVTGLSSA